MNQQGGIRSAAQPMGGGRAPDTPLYLVGADTSARPHPSRPLHQGPWGLVLDFFVWEGPLIHSKKIMNGFGNMPVNPPQNDDVIIILGA